MTMPGAGRGQPPLEQAAQDVIAGVRGERRRMPPELPPRPLTPDEKKEADRVAQARLYCSYCAGAHAMPSTAACPRLASVELDGDGTVRKATFWPGRRWAKGRVTFIEDLLEQEGDDGAR